MSKGNARDPKLERYWRGQSERQRVSGLTIRDYCVEQGLSESSFHFWRREIAKRDEQREAASAAAAAPEFVPVTIVEPAVPAWPMGTAIDIKLASGHRLRVRVGCDQRLLAEVVAVLEGRSC